MYLSIYQGQRWYSSTHQEGQICMVFINSLGGSDMVGIHQLIRWVRDGIHQLIRRFRYGIHQIIRCVREWNVYINSSGGSQDGIRQFIVVRDGIHQLVMGVRYGIREFIRVRDGIHHISSMSEFVCVNRLAVFFRPSIS